jgi:D-alanyl-D-alanine carboxypeptidase
MVRWPNVAFLLVVACAVVDREPCHPDAAAPRLLPPIRRAESRGLIDGVVVVDTGRRLLSHTSRDLRPVDTATVFRIASVSKALAAITAIEMSRDGVVNLRRPVVEQWPEIGGLIADDITPAQLMTMTSGLPRELRPEEGCCLLSLDAAGRSEASLVRQPPLRTVVRPGTEVLYSNVGYWILGGLLESAHGATFADAVRTHLLAPAAMSRTYFGDPPPGVPLVTPGSTFSGSAIVRVRGRFASGGWTSTADDLVRLCRHLGERRWTEKDWRLLRRSANVPSSPEGDALVWSGSQPGTAALFWCEPEQSVSVVVLSRVNPDPPDALLRLAADLVALTP